jgi:hypothetical protein
MHRKLSTAKRVLKLAFDQRDRSEFKPKFMAHAGSGDRYER